MNQKIDSIKSLIIEIERIKNDGNFKEAIKLIEESIIKYNEDYRLYEELSDTALYLGLFEKAEKAINHALKLNPESATGNYLKGFLYLNSEEYKKGLKVLEKSNKLMGNNPEVLRNLGWAYTMNNQVTKGISILKRALIIAPGDRLITEDLAMALIGVGEVEKGNKLLEQIGVKKKMVK